LPNVILQMRTWSQYASDILFSLLSYTFNGFRHVSMRRVGCQQALVVFALTLSIFRLVICLYLPWWPLSSWQLPY